jgi:hypothetical protein
VRRAPPGRDRGRGHRGRVGHLASYHYASKIRADSQAEGRQTARSAQRRLGDSHGRNNAVCDTPV